MPFKMSFGNPAIRLKMLINIFPCRDVKAYIGVVVRLKNTYEEAYLARMAPRMLFSQKNKRYVKYYYTTLTFDLTYRMQRGIIKTIFR